MNPLHRVVIVGGGFGGLYAAKALKRAPVSLTLLDRRNFHLFQPLLYQVATGSLSPGEIAAPLRAVLKKQKNTQVLLGEAVDLDMHRRRVILDDGELEYDTLVVAAGARNNYFGHDGWQQIAPGLKSVEEATAIRQKILLAFEAAEREPDPQNRRSWLTFVVVGAGPTGVELAGALGEIANDTLKGNFRTIAPEDSRIFLLDGSPRILPPFPEDLSAKAERALIRLGVQTRTSVNVTGIDEEGVTIQTARGTERIPARTVIWSAGVTASALGRVLAEKTGAKLDKGGRILVEPDLSVSGHPEIFAIGDLANFSHQDGKPLPGIAPVAMQQGRYVAAAIQNRLNGKASKPFRYFNKGNLAVIGRNAAVVDFGWARFQGLFAWLIWVFVHLMYIVEFESRILVFIHWGFQYFTYNRGARLITGETKMKSHKKEPANV